MKKMHYLIRLNKPFDCGLLEQIITVLNRFIVWRGWLEVVIDSGLPKRLLVQCLSPLLGICWEH
jgi:hypothetical protein